MTTRPPVPGRTRTARLALLTTASALLLAAPASAGLSGTSLYEGEPMQGTVADEEFDLQSALTGAVVDGLGDVNGDGRDDVAVSDQAESADFSATARSRVIFGGQPSGVRRTAALGSGGFTIKARGSITGPTLTRAGDVDADGYADVLVTSFFAPPTLVYGSPSTAEVDIMGEPSARFTRVASASGTAPARGVGDMDGDGYDDVVFPRSPDTFFGSGRLAGATILYGGPRVEQLDLAGEDEPRVAVIASPVPLGSVANVGDVNADGLADALVAPDEGNAGTLSVVFGAETREELDVENLGDRGQRIVTEDDTVKTPVDGVGDITGDGIADIAYTPAYSDFAVTVVPGRAAPGTIDVASTPVVRITNVFEATHSAAGDQNRDGRADLVVRTANAEGTIGKLRVIRGRPAPATIDARTQAEVPGLPDALLGFTVRYSIASAGDVDGDRRPDLVLGATSLPVGGKMFSGGAYLLTHGRDRVAPRVFPPFTDVESGESGPAFVPDRFTRAAGSTLKYPQVEDAALTVTVRRAGSGRLVGFKLYPTVAGGLDLAFDGRLIGLPLTPGDYTADLVPVDASLNPGERQRVTFTITG